MDLSGLEYGDIYVRRFTKESEITEEDLKSFHSELLDIQKKRKFEPFNITVVSTTPYNQKAIEFVENEDNWIKDTCIDLILEKPESYEVIWAGF